MELWVCSDRPDGIPLRHVNVVEAVGRMIVEDQDVRRRVEDESLEDYFGRLLAAAVREGEDDDWRTDQGRADSHGNAAARRSR